MKVEIEKKPYELYDVYCTLSEAHKAVWDEMAKTSVAWLDDNPTVAKLPMEKRLRLRQMALGFPEIGEEGEVGFAEDCESPKLDVAERIKKRHVGQSVLYVTDSAKFARVAAKRLGAELFYGPTPKKERQRLLAGFGTEFKYLVCTYGAIAEGTDGIQEHCHIEVMFNPADSSVQNEQFSGRLNRTGQPADRIIRYRLLARDTLDELHGEQSLEKVLRRRAELC